MEAREKEQKAKLKIKDDSFGIGYVERCDQHLDPERTCSFPSLCLLPPLPTTHELCWWLFPSPHLLLCFASPTRASFRHKLWIFSRNSEVIGFKLKVSSGISSRRSLCQVKFMSSCLFAMNITFPDIYDFQNMQSWIMGLSVEFAKCHLTFLGRILLIRHVTSRFMIFEIQFLNILKLIKGFSTFSA